MGRKRNVDWELWEPVLRYSGPDMESPGFLEPIFGNQPFTPQTTCKDIHPGGPIPKGSACCCMACNKSGKDHLKLKGVPVGSKLNEDYEPDEPEPQPTSYAPSDSPPLRKTRKQRRAEQFNHPAD